MADLIRRREEILAEHRAQEKYDPFWMGEAAAGRRLSERPVAFLCDDEVVILGSCVGKILDGLRIFVEASAPVFTDPEKASAMPVYQQHAFAKARRLLAQHPTPPAELRVHQQHWNAITHGLSTAGVLAVTTEGTHA